MRHYKLRRHKGCEGECLNSFEKRSSEHRFQGSFQRNCQVCLLFNLTLQLVDFLDLLSPFIVVHMYSRRVSGESGLIWRDFHALCAML